MPDFDLRDLETVEVFFYHDGPRLYSARTGAGDLVLVNCVDEDEDGSPAYLVTALPPHLHEALDSRPLRDIVLDGSKLGSWSVLWEPEAMAAVRIDPDSIPDAWLPRPGSVLKKTGPAT